MKALITGVTGQDGFYLAELLNNKGYEVYGLVRRTSQDKAIPANVHIIEGDVTDSSGTARAIGDIKPDEIYHLGAMSHVGESFKIPSTTFQINALGTINLLEAVRSTWPHARFYNAATSELFGISPSPQSEQTTFHPRSPYAVAKLAAYWATINYREAYHLHASNGILFNHESPRRGSNFVTQKIATGVAKIALGKATGITLGNLDSSRDWGHARDYVYGMWLMLQKEWGDDYVLATGQTHSIRDFLQEAFGVVGIHDYMPYISIDKRFMRPSEVPELCGDSTKAQTELGWRPTTTFKELVKEMVDAAIERE